MVICLERGANDLHYGPADATVTLSCLASLKSGMVLFFWCWLTHVVPECNGCNVHCESKKLCHFYFYCNFGKCWSILKILLLLESEGSI